MTDCHKKDKIHIGEEKEKKRENETGFALSRFADPRGCLAWEKSCHFVTALSYLLTDAVGGSPTTQPKAQNWLPNFESDCVLSAVSGERGAPLMADSEHLN